MWYIKTFEELSSKELYTIIQERISVFIVEQDCAYMETDDNDLISTHIYLKNDEDIVAYARVFPNNENIHVGRVLVKKEYRSQGKANELLEKVLDHIKQTEPDKTIEMMAEEYVQELYESFGFKTISEPYIDCGILHVDMIKEPEAP